MTKRKGGAKASTRTDPASPNRPRIIPQEHLLSRFYEPLVLLYTLGRTRGDHVRAATPSQKDIAHLPLLDIRRMFLNDLAYMCDYDKGGETVTAIGLQSTPQKHIFWVASNTGSKAKTIEFVRSILAQIVYVSAASKATQPATELASQCIAFSTLRIKKYRSLLKPLLRKCTLYLAKIEQEVEPGLLEWLQSWEYASSLLDLCCSAHASRKSNFMRALARLSAEPTYGSNRDAIHVAFGMIRHYIGRLGYHFRAADTLVACAPRLFYLLHDFEVCSVPIPVKSAIPPPDEMTTLDKILVRMLPANSPELHLYQETLAYMNDRYQLFSRYMDNYVRPNRGSCVHAEIQVLEHFYINGMHFACDDPFIACSKPACFCCLLYFRHHPGHVVEPVSHNKIYLNWRPPDFHATAGIISPNHQRDILNAMNQEIRKEALHQLRGKTAPRAWHPDSLTNITWSAPSEQSEQVVRGIDDAPGLAADRTVSCGRSESPYVSGSGGAFLITRTTEEGGTNVRRGASDNVASENILQICQPPLEEFVSDSDENGGVQLEV